MSMRRLTAVVLRHRLFVCLVWIAITVLGGLFVGKANSGLSHAIATPGLAGYDANVAMSNQLGIDGAEAPIIAVMRLPPGKSMRTGAGRTLAAQAFASAATHVGHVALVDYATSHDARLISADGNSTWAIYDVPNPDIGTNKNDAANLTPALAKATPAGAHITVTGNEALQSTGSGSGSGLSTLTETLIGAAAALIVLAFVYGSAIAVVPLMMALPSILVAFRALYGLEQLEPAPQREPAADARAKPTAASEHDISATCSTSSQARDRFLVSVHAGPRIARLLRRPACYPSDGGQ